MKHVFHSLPEAARVDGERKKAHWFLEPGKNCVEHLDRPCRRLLVLLARVNAFHWPDRLAFIYFFACCSAHRRFPLWNVAERAQHKADLGHHGWD